MLDTFQQMFWGLILFVSGLTLIVLNFNVPIERNKMTRSKFNASFYIWAGVGSLIGGIYLALKAIF